MIDVTSSKYRAIGVSVQFPRSGSSLLGVREWINVLIPISIYAQRIDARQLRLVGPLAIAGGSSVRLP
jgi:hypothetical protein